MSKGLVVLTPYNKSHNDLAKQTFKVKGTTLTDLHIKPGDLIDGNEIARLVQTGIVVLVEKAR